MQKIEKHAAPKLDKAALDHRNPPVLDKTWTGRYTHPNWMAISAKHGR